MAPPRKPPLPAGLVNFTFFLTASFFLATIALFQIPWPGPRPDHRIPFTVLGLILSLSLAGVLVMRADAPYRRALVKAQGGFWCLLALGFAALEWSSRPQWPPFPQRFLHGNGSAHPFPQTQDGDSPLSNRWGQRDRDRALQPGSGVWRGALVGSEPLERSEGPPLNVRLEEAMGPTREWLNLGVSDSALRDSYWRARQLGEPLGVQHWVAVVQWPDDLAPPLDEETRLPTHLAHLVWNDPLVPSLLGQWLPALTHRWFHSDRTPQWKKELALVRRLNGLSGDGLVQTLSQVLPVGERALFTETFQGESLETLQRTLKRPEGGRLGARFLRRMLSHAVRPEPTPMDTNTLERNVAWVKALARLCRHRQASLTVVLSPAAEEADPEVRARWNELLTGRDPGPLYRRERQHFLDALGEDISTVDLTEVLSAAGTFLPGEGVWSEEGQRRVVQALTSHWGGPSTAAVP